IALEQLRWVNEAFLTPNRLQECFLKSALVFRERVQTCQSNFTIEQLGGTLFAAHQLHRMMFHCACVEEEVDLAQLVRLVQAIGTSGGLHHGRKVEGKLKVNQGWEGDEIQTCFHQFRIADDDI